MSLQLAAIAALCAMAAPTPEVTSEGPTKRWGISGLVTASLTPGSRQGSQASIDGVLAVGGYFNLSKAFAVFSSIRAERTLVADPADPILRRFYLRDLNVGISGTFIEPASQIKLIGRCSADLPTSEQSQEVGRVLAPILGLSAERIFEDLGVGDLRLRLATELRLNVESDQSDKYDLFNIDVAVTEAHSVRTTGTGTYAFDNGISVSTGLAWVKARHTTQQVRGIPVFAASQVDARVDTVIVGIELAYNITENIGLAAGYSAATNGSYRDGSHRNSNTRPPQLPYFFTDTYAWSGRRFYLSLAAIY